MPICEMGWVRKLARDPCRFCSEYTTSAVRAAGFPLLQLKDFLAPKETRSARETVDKLGVGEYPGFVWDGLAIGRLVQASLQWISRAASPEGQEDYNERYRDLLVAGTMIAMTGRRLLDHVRPDVVLLLNGMFFEERLLFEMCQTRGIRVVTYERGRGRNTLFFAKGRPACGYDLGEAWQMSRTEALTPKQGARLDQHMDERSRGHDVVERYWDSVTDEEDAVVRELGLDRSKKTVSLFTNITWDTAVQGRDKLFDSMFEWVKETIDHFRDRTDGQLVIRIHPAEVQVAGRETNEYMEDYISQVCPVLPANVRIVPPARSVSSYTIMRIADVGLTYASTVGIEMAMMGAPVIVAAEAPYRGKGFTYDPKDKDQYSAMVDRLLAHPESHERDRVRETARRYGYLFFFRATLPFRHVQEVDRAVPRLDYQHVSDLRPGQDRVLDMICRGLLDDGDFILPSNSEG